MKIILNYASHAMTSQPLISAKTNVDFGTKIVNRIRA
jgi:hypothetical protein